MPAAAQPAAAAPASPPPASLTARAVAAGNGWSVCEFTCTAGPDDRAFEERHADVAISALLAGSFRYRTDSGSALLHPGSLLLGNPDACFECGHDHSRGDRCLAVHFTPGLFAEIAASRTGRSGWRFAHAMLPALPGLTPALGALQALASPAAGSGAASSTNSADRHARIEQAALLLAETVLTIASGETPSAAAPNAREHRRIAAVLHYLEDHADEKVTLDDMAAVAIMSKYHFLRCFRRITGMTPYDYLLGLRLRRAAARLRDSRDSIAAIAFDAGFGDLSTFNARFRDVFGVTPGGWRLSGGQFSSDDRSAPRAGRG